MLQTPIQGFRLSLREFNEGDTPAIIRIAATSGFSFYALAPHTAQRAEIEKTATSLVQRAIRLQKADPQTGIRENYKLAVTEIDSPEKLIGYVALDEWSEANDEKRDIGYFIDPRKQGQGYATQASILLLDRFFSVTSYNLVHATAHPENGSSRRVLNKLGYTEIDQITKTVHGILEPRIVLTLHRDNYFRSVQEIRDKTIDQKPARIIHPHHGARPYV